MVLFQEHKWTARRRPEQQSRIRKKRWAASLRNLDTSVEWLPQRRVELQLVSAVLLSGSVVVLCTTIGISEQNTSFLDTLGQVLRAIIVGGGFNLGEVLQQSGWLHAVRARTAAPCNATPTCLESMGKGRVIDFFVVSEELHSLCQGSGSGRQSHNHTHLPAGRASVGVCEAREARLGSSKGYAGLPAPHDRTSGPVLPCGGDALWKRRSSDGVTWSTRRNTQAGWQRWPRDSNIFWSGEGPTCRGRRSGALESAGATYWSPAQHACEGTHCEGLQCHLQHTS